MTFSPPPFPFLPYSPSHYAATFPHRATKLRLQMGVNERGIELTMICRSLDTCSSRSSATAAACSVVAAEGEGGNRFDAGNGHDDDKSRQFALFKEDVRDFEGGGRVELMMRELPPASFHRFDGGLVDVDLHWGVLAGGGTRRGARRVRGGREERYKARGGGRRWNLRGMRELSFEVEGGERARRLAGGRGAGVLGERLARSGSSAPADG